MLRFFYDTRYKYTNRTLIDVSSDTSYRDIDYANIDSPDTINGNIIYRLEAGENVPTYVMDLSRGTRYFVSGITPLSANRKFQISLLRDIISESKNWALEDAYIEAGVATDFNKYKRWNLPFTNTKIKEQRLNFGGKSSFFVFYVNEQQVDGSGTITENDYELNMASFPGMTVDEYTTVTNLNVIPGFSYVGAGNVYVFNTETMTARTKMRYQPTGPLAPSVPSDKVVRVDITHNIKSSQTSNGWYNPININDEEVLDHTINMAGSLYDDILSNTNSCKTQIGTALANFSNAYKSNNYSNIGNQTVIDNLINNYTNRFIYNQADQKVYRINYTNNSFTENKIINKSDTTTLTTALQNVNIPTYPGNTSTFAITDNGYCQVNYGGMYYNFTIEELGKGSSFDFNFKANVQKLPKSAVRCVNIVSGATASVDDEVISQALMLAQQNQLDIDDNIGQIIDIQYLPFSVATTANADIKINGQNQYATFLSNDDFQFFTNMSDLTNINKETDTINIVSPSRQSQFMFRPYDNDGNMEFTTSVTIKPFASTIYVRPSTKGLLQYDWQDKDCLVISEDFSLTKVSSSWADYVRSNKNYQRVFDRNLQSKAYERDWERRIEREQARSDEYNATMLANQQGRNLTGNLPIISTITGLFSQGLSQLGGDNAYTRYMSAAQLDRQYNEAMYQESVRLAQDQFNLQLENIKSQPLIPTNITTIDCKLLDGVYLEFYSTNPTEKKAISDFYRYNGNRIETFGKFEDYYGWYVKGKIIKAVNYTQPEIDEVNRRLSTGIFTEVSYD